MKNISAVLSAAMAFAATGIQAQDTTERLSGSNAVVAEMDMHVTEKASDAVSAHLDESHSAVLKSLAHQYAVAENCDGFEVDETKASAEMAFALEPIAAIEDQDAREAATMVTMMGFSVLLGGQHAIAAYDYGKFCRHATDEMSDEEGSTDHVILVSGG